MDYQVFLLSRIREDYLRHGDNDRAVVAGLERTGRVITAAALVVASVLICLATSGLSILKLLGVGLAMAVLVDAVLVRGILVPALMRMLGPANWWAPAPLARLHDRIGWRER
jgi:RND superfamily putative drug exporter